MLISWLKMTKHAYMHPPGRARMRARVSRMFQVSLGTEVQSPGGPVPLRGGDEFPVRDHATAVALDGGQRFSKDIGQLATLQRTLSQGREDLAPLFGRGLTGNVVEAGARVRRQDQGTLFLRVSSADLQPRLFLFPDAIEPEDRADAGTDPVRPRSARSIVSGLIF